MKRYRHYKKNRAIVLSCFGSVIEQQKYIDLEEIVVKAFPDCDVFMSFSSRMVIKLLKKKKNEEYKNLPQTLADIDMLGYKHIVVSSINIFPTDEHEYFKKIVNGFKSFSLANINHTNAILTKTNDTTSFFKFINEKISKDEVANLYIIHGTPRLDISGIDSITYVSSFLELIDERNFTCSLEGSFPYNMIKNTLKQKINKLGFKKVQIIPILLVSGNHYIKDMYEIRDDLSISFESSLVDSLTNSKEFNLIELPEIQDIIIENIKETFLMSGISYKETLV